MKILNDNDFEKVKNIEVKVTEKKQLDEVGR